MKKIIIANLKAYMTYDDILNYNVNEDVIVCPSSIYIPYFLNKNIKIGLQDISHYDLGAHTGDICPIQAKELGVNYILIGHSERRNVDSDEIINLKIKKCFENNLNVILCIGENKKEKLEEQLNKALSNVDNIDNLIIAYEPVWCIGTGITPTNNQIEASINFIQTIINKKYNKSSKIIYGGSVDENNISILNQIPNLSGFLIGKAAIDCNKLNKIVNIINRQN